MTMIKPVLIGMAVHNQWQVTKDCLDSLTRWHDMSQMELLIIDNASTEPWPKNWLNDPDIRWSAHVHRNEENLYCARAWNQVLSAAKPGQLVVIINNDIEVGPGFLEELQRVAVQHPGSMATTRVLGLAKPEQQRPGPPGVVQVMPKWFRQLTGVVFSGFLETYKKVQGFDTAYKTPWYEDDDFWMRCHQEGVPVLIAPVMVYHRGEVTSHKVSFDRYANEKYFYTRWRKELGPEAERMLGASKDAPLLQPGPKTPPKKLSILVLSIPSRIKTSMARVVEKLVAQALGKPVEILCLTDNKTSSVGKKRNALLQLAVGEYLAFVDDDDDVADDYVDSILKAVTAETDCVVFDAQVTGYTDSPKTCRMSLSYQKETEDEERYYRLPDHKMVYRSAIAKKHQFPDLNYGEDHVWSKAVNGMAKSETRIDKVLYFYRFSPEKSETLNP